MCCREYNKKLFVVLQVNSHNEDVFISENQLRFQAFSALAFGASAISWACYTAGWWHNQVLDINGNKTEQYNKLKRVNSEVKSLTREYICFKWVDTLKIYKNEASSFDFISDVISSEDALLGVFENESHEKAVFYSMINYDGNNNTLTFRATKNKTVCLHTACEKKKIYPNAEGAYSLFFENAEACFITVW